MKNVSTEERLHRPDMKPMSKEVKQRRWRMIEHILRQDQNNNCNIAITWAPEGKRRRGRPKATWKRTTVEKERAEAGWQSWEDVKTIANDWDRGKRIGEVWGVSVYDTNFFWIVIIILKNTYKIPVCIQNWPCQKSLKTIFILLKTNKFAFKPLCPTTGQIDKYDAEWFARMYNNLQNGSRSRSEG